MNDISGTKISNNIIQFLSHHGVPKQILADNDTVFKNTIVTKILALH